MSNSKPLKVDYSSRAMPLAIEKLHLSEDQADFHFIVKASDGTFVRVPAHKLLLMSVSSVFRAMFSGLWNEMEEVEIVDASVAAFREFLQVFYFTDIKLTMENAGEVMNLVNKYDINNCLDICAEFMQNNINVYNVCAAYEVAIRLEAETFEALLSWIKAQCKSNDLKDGNLQGQFDDLWQEIRFGLLTAQDCPLLDPRTLFTYDEFSEIFQMMGSDEYKPTIFSNNRKERNRIAKVEDHEGITCSRLLSQNDSAKPYFIKNEETTSFSVNKHVWLTAICHDVSDYRDNRYNALKQDLPCNIKVFKLGDLLHIDGKKILHEQQIIIRKSNEFISLSKAILIRPGILYEIQMKQTPPDNCCSGSLMKSLVEIFDDVTVKFYNDPEANDTIAKRGLIDRLKFKKLFKTTDQLSSSQSK